MTFKIQSLQQIDESLFSKRLNITYVGQDPTIVRSVNIRVAHLFHRCFGKATKFQLTGFRQGEIIHLNTKSLEKRLRRGVKFKTELNPSTLLKRALNSYLNSAEEHFKDIEQCQKKTPSLHPNSKEEWERKLKDLQTPINFRRCTMKAIQKDMPCPHDITPPDPVVKKTDESIDKFKKSLITLFDSNLREQKNKKKCQKIILPRLSLRKEEQSALKEAVKEYNGLLVIRMLPNSASKKAKAIYKKLTEVKKVTKKEFLKKVGGITVTLLQNHGAKVCSLVGQRIEHYISSDLKKGKSRFNWSQVANRASKVAAFAFEVAAKNDLLLAQGVETYAAMRTQAYEAKKQFLERIKDDKESETLSLDKQRRLMISAQEKILDLLSLKI